MDAIDKLINQDAEEGVLGSVLINPNCFNEVRQVINSNDFKLFNNKNTWIAFENLVRKNSSIDIITVSDELSRIDHLNSNEANFFLLSLIEKTPSSINVVDYANLVKEKSCLRDCVLFAQEIAKSSIDQKSTIESIDEKIFEFSRFRQSSVLDQNNKFQIISSKDCLINPPNINWIIEDLISSGSINVLVGDSGTKKTFIGIWLAECLSNGFDFLSMKTKKTNVIYIDEEMGRIPIQIRFGQAERGIKANKDTEVLIHPGFGLNFHTNPLHIEYLEGLIMERSIHLVILDALSDIMAGGDENSSKDVSPFFLKLIKLAKKTDCAFLIMHHTNRDGKFRGSSDIKSKVDLMLEIDSKDGSSDLKFRSVKVRHGKPLSFNAKIYWEKDRFWISEMKKDHPDLLTEEENFILDFLRSNAESSRQDILDNREYLEEKKVSNAVYSLMRKKIIHRTNPHEKGKGKQAYYDLTENR